MRGNIISEFFQSWLDLPVLRDVWVLGILIAGCVCFCSGSSLYCEMVSHRTCVKNSIQDSFLEPIRSRDMCLVGAFLLSSWTWCQRMRRHPSNRKLQRSHIAPRFKRLIDQSDAQSRWYWWRQPIAKSWARDPSHRYISNYTKYCFFAAFNFSWLGYPVFLLFRCFVSRCSIYLGMGVPVTKTNSPRQCQSNPSGSYSMVSSPGILCFESGTAVGGTPVGSRILWSWRWRSATQQLIKMAVFLVGEKSAGPQKVTGSHQSFIR